MSAARETLHHLVDALTDADVDAARRVLEGLVISANDEVSDLDEATIARARAAVATSAGTPGDAAAAHLRAKYG